MEGADSQIGVRPGEVLAGKYLVERVLGQGGMGVVVAAKHLQLEERVALKFLLPAALQSPEAVSRFLREARAAVKIKSEYVARVSDVGQLENGAPYMVMEYLDGGDLAAWLSQRGALPVEQAIEFVLQACVAVADAHALGIVHRDLKPANLFCLRRSDGQLSIKVLDFGISKLTNAAAAGAPSMQMTKTASLMGTPLYMSPEQMRSSREVDQGTDIWALGAIVYELLAGRPAFLAETVTELAIKVANEPPPPLRAFRPDLPPGLENVVLKCLEKDRTRRFRNVADLATALLPYAPPRARGLVDRIAGIIQSAGGLVETAVAPPTAGPGLADPSHASAGTFPAVGRTTVGGSSAGKAAAIGGGAFAVLAVIGAVAFFALSRKDHTGAEPPANPATTSAPPATTAPPQAQTLPPIPSAPPPATAETAATLAPVAPQPPPVQEPPVQAPPAQPPAARPAAPPPHPAPQAVPANPPHAAPPAAQPAPAGKPPTNNCDPPYFFDARGNRTFKPECL